MTRSIEAVFDGTTLRPDEPLELPPNTRVRLTIESLAPPTPGGWFLRTAHSLALAGHAMGRPTSRPDSGRCCGKIHDDLSVIFNPPVPPRSRAMQ